MMIVTATRPSAQQSSGDLPREPERHETPAIESRALVALAPISDHAPAAGFREAPFLAQLIATREQLPQTRERRRAEPGEAIAAYRAAAALTEHD
jgi:hypothetical protein